MFSEKVKKIISSAKSHALSYKKEALDIESVLAAIQTNVESNIRLAECYDYEDRDKFLSLLPDYNQGSYCTVKMYPDEGLQSVLQSAYYFAGGEGIPDRTFPGLVLLEHLICALAMSVDTAEILDNQVLPITEEKALSCLSGWILDSGGSISLGGLTRQLKDLRNELLSNVFGQDHAIHAFIEGLYNSEVVSGSDSIRKRPMGLFVFAGPPGVGKTYMSELCASFMKKPFRRFDMTGYSDHQAYNDLVGFAPSYKGAKPGLLTGFVKENPDAFLLFDEIEKANITTMQLFYQILDSGRLQDKFEDEDVSFKDTIIIFTTNAGKTLYDNPNKRGITVASSNYHKRTILSALENEKNPANGQPAFPQAICSRLGQGYPVMFNHLGVNELEQIVESELIKTELLLERQYFKKFVHSQELPLILVLKEGANIDARQHRSEAERFIKKEIFKFSSMYEADRLDSVMDEIEEVCFTGEIDDSKKLAEINGLMSFEGKPAILLAGSDELISYYQENIPEIDWKCVSNEDEAVEVLSSSDVDFILLDLWMGSSPEISNENNSDIFKSISSDADFTPLNSRSLDKGRRILNLIQDRHPDTQIYLLSAPEDKAGLNKIDNSEDLINKSIAIGAGLNESNLSEKALMPGRVIDEDLLLACMRSGGARGLVSTFFGFGDESEESRNSLLTSIKKIHKRLYREKIAANLAKQHRTIDFDTRFSINKNEKKLIVSINEFRVKRSFNSSDVEHMVSDTDRPSIKFKDVFGAQEPKKSMQFIVDWLKEPKRFSGLGLRPPKGILMTGPPGTGKTMLAKAVAGESDCAFCQTSASSFVTKWQGSGPQNIRDLFARARRYAPSIVFIDEIDAIGKARQGSSNTRTQEDTLNALLTEMDGFGSSEGLPVIVLAATNLADKLDPALKRRFDREILVDRPDRDARLSYLSFSFSQRREHNVTDKVLSKIATQSPGMTIAELSRIVQEAGILALHEKIPVADSHLLESFDKLRFGEQAMTKSKEALLRTARHEGGHAYVGWKLGKGIFNVTIIGRKGSGGHVEWKPSENYLQTKSQIEDQICACMAGRAAELYFYGEDDGLSTGVGKAVKGNSGGGDLPKATELALDMVRGFGMCSDIGQVSIDVLAEAYSPQPMAEITLKLAGNIIEKQMNRAKEMIRSDIDTFNKLVDSLVERNRLDENSIIEILGVQE